MLAPEPLRGTRVVADPAALEALAARLPKDAAFLRFAPDEALIVDIDIDHVSMDDPDAIVEREAGFVAVTVDHDLVARHTDWHLPDDDTAGPAQGAVAGIPAKLIRRPDGRVTIVTHGAYAADLLSRLR